VGKRSHIKGRSYLKRVEDINRIYNEHIRDGLSNREILRRYIRPIYPISEATFYNILNAEVKIEESKASIPDNQLKLWDDNNFNK